ncbi:dehydrogenase [Terrihabitans soli]|uniref:Dehydrogenase n=1 Tax=Terrihabitans soli TaxID=708113 RepID=A0A6S6QS18_9HYPH|nr:NAD(P)H-dependent oxidoreductase [Terrihabitans soli]BCJ89680.1 dehydrogenase [Terrihabitans soli]
MTRILVLQGHPDTRSSHLCHQLAEAYASAAEENGHLVRRMELGKTDIPILRSRAEWESRNVPIDIGRAQESLVWADHLLIVFPLWLGDMPALVKAFFEQVLRPGFAVSGDVGSGFKPLLAGRSARIVMTMGMPAFVYKWYFGAHCLKLLQRNILRFVGIKADKTTLIGSVEKLTERQRLEKLSEMRRLGAAAC